MKGLFDEPEEVDDLPDNDWREVPQALFDSWPNERQLAYCRDRDENAALYAPTLQEAMWHQERANSYSKEIAQCRTSMRKTNPKPTTASPDCSTDSGPASPPPSAMSMLAEDM